MAITKGYTFTYKNSDVFWPTNYNNFSYVSMLFFGQNTLKTQSSIARTYYKLFPYHFEFGAKIQKYLSKMKKCIGLQKENLLWCSQKKIPKIYGPKAHFFLRKCIGLGRMYMINCGCLSSYHSGFISFIHKFWDIFKGSHYHF